MDRSQPSQKPLECSSCGNPAFGEGEILCCERPMASASDDTPAVAHPSLEELLRTVFDMNESELDICLCVMEGGEKTVEELAEEVGYDRSVVSLHLNHLFDPGVVDERRRILKGGGQVYIYAPKEPDVVKRNLEDAFVAGFRKRLAARFLKSG